MGFSFSSKYILSRFCRSITTLSRSSRYHDSTPLSLWLTHRVTLHLQYLWMSPQFPTRRVMNTMLNPLTSDVLDSKRRLHRSVNDKSPESLIQYWSSKSTGEAYSTTYDTISFKCKSNQSSLDQPASLIIRHSRYPPSKSIRNLIAALDSPPRTIVCHFRLSANIVAWFP